jgi:hypothetical protein
MADSSNERDPLHLVPLQLGPLPLGYWYVRPGSHVSD